jgi:hypothetical protein
MALPLQALAEALARDCPELGAVAFEPMPDTGLAHWHVRLAGHGLVARVPKQSQMGLPAQANIDYQSTCFDRAAPSGHTPRRHATLPPRAGLPRGALIVEAIDGRPAELPLDLGAIVEALAALHALPLPDPTGRAPLRDPADLLRDLTDEITAQAGFLEGARMAPGAAATIEQAMRRLQAGPVAVGGAPAALPRRLIAFDAHPGNFLVRADGRAVLVDLEKARYGAPPLDLAHATLYTSTTWDLHRRAVLSVDEVEAAARAWMAHLGSLGEALRPWIVPLREAMWLWAVTWCAKWRVLSDRAADAPRQGEDWSSELSDATLVSHVRERVGHYLGDEAVERVRAELLALHARLA